MLAALGSILDGVQKIELAGHLAFGGCGDVMRRKSPADGFLVGRVHQRGVRQPDLDQLQAFAKPSRKQVVDPLHTLWRQAAGSNEVLRCRTEDDFGEEGAFFGGCLHHAGFDALRDCQRKQRHRGSYRDAGSQDKLLSKSQRRILEANLARSPNHCRVSLRRARNIA